MALTFYLQSLRRNWWLILLCALAAAVISLTAAYFTRPVYQTTTRFIIAPDQSLLTTENEVVNSLNTLDKRSIAATYAEVLNSDRLLAENSAALGIDAVALEEYKFSTAVLPAANILELTVEGPDPELIVQLANKTGQNAVSYIRSLYTVYTLSSLDPATIPLKPVRPQPARDVVLAFVLGIALGAGLAIAREQVRMPMAAFLQRNEIDRETMMLTRFQLENRLNDLINRKTTRTLSLGIVRLEGLNGYLDILPQPVLQQIMRQVTQIFENELRGSDIVGRWNRFSLAVILQDTPSQAAVSTFGRLQVALSKAVKFGMEGESLLLLPIVGLAEHQAGSSSNTLMRQAEKALAQATRSESKFTVSNQPPAAEPLAPSGGWSSAD